MRFLYDNIMDDYTLAASSSATGYSSVNLIDAQLDKVHRTNTVLSNTYKLSGTATALTASCAVILGHNLTASAAIYIQGNDTDAWAAATTSVEFSAWGTIYSVVFTEATHKYWQFALSDAGNTDGYIEIGLLDLGVQLDWTNGIGTDFPLEYMDTSTKEFSRTGQIFGNEGILYRTFRITFPMLNDTERQSLVTMYDTVKTAIPLVWWPDETYQTRIEPVYGIFTENLSFNHLFNWNYNGAITLREVF